MKEIEGNEPSASALKNPSVVAALWLISLCWVFLVGYFFRAILLPQPTTTLPSPSPSLASPIPSSSPATGNDQFIPFKNPSTGAGNVYFNDTFTVLAETTPPQLLVVTHTTSQNAPNSFTQQSRVSYFDGETWHRNVGGTTSSTADFVPNTTLTGFDMFQDKSRVLKQKAIVFAVVDGNSMQLDTDILENEITMRTEPTYTRFISDSTGEIAINGMPHRAKVMYSKWYSMDNSKLSFYSTEYGLKTHVLDFWADDGSVLHIDSTQVQNPNDIYSSHQIGIYKDAVGKIAKTFDLAIETDKNLVPQAWNMTVGLPVSLTFAGRTTTSLKRPEGEEYDWYRGLVEGQITLSSGQVIKGIGTFEYINEL